MEAAKPVSRRATLLALGLVAAASATLFASTAAGGPDGGVIPLIGQCQGGTVCAMPNGCYGRTVCLGNLPKCECAGGGGTTSCNSCGVVGTAACNSSCGAGTCSAPPPSPRGCQTGNGCSGTQTCNQGSPNWNPCTNCTGTGSCIACGIAGGSGACNSSCQVTTCSGTTQACPNPSGCTTVGNQTCTNNTWGPCTGCGGQSSSPCITSCGGDGGTGTCGSNCTVAVCAPPAEVCNGKDDDCNGLVDDGITCDTCDGP